MTNGSYYNAAAAEWARQNLTSPVSIRPLFSSRKGRIFTYGLLFCVPGFFVAFGIAAGILFGLKDRSVVFGPIVIGVLMLIPCGLIAFLGAYVRRGFAKSLDAEAVRGSMGQALPWRKLVYVDHVTKHIRAGGVSRQVKDNQIELVFETGKAIIPPLIHEREQIWNLIDGLPADVRDDGVPRLFRQMIGQDI